VVLSSLSLPLLIEERSGITRFNEPVTVGIPLPPGVVMQPDKLVLLDQTSQPSLLQSQVLARWFDESVQWVLLDFQTSVGAYESVTYHLQQATEPVMALRRPRLTVRQSADALVVETGKAVFCLNSQLGKPFERVLMHESDLLAAGGSRLVLTDAEGQEYDLHVRKMDVETSGSLRVTVHIQGDLRKACGPVLAHCLARLSFYDGHTLVQCQITLHNPRAAHHPGGLWDLGDEGSIFFKDLSLHIPLRDQAGLRTVWLTQPDQPGYERAATHLVVYQDSSGGENWQSTNHVNRFGKVMHTFQGYRVTADGCTLEEGKRATPILALHNGTHGVVSSVEKFWQNFPKALEVHHNQLTVRLFPQQYNDVYELQGGEQKTHTAYLLFTDTPEAWARLGWVHDRLLPRTTPEWYAHTRAFNYLTACVQDQHAEDWHLIETAIKGPHSFFARREIIDEYGWRHFGDLYADHEAVGHTGQTPLISHYNNQYDGIYGAIIQYVRSGDWRWFELARDLAHHVIDIDIYHTDADRPAYNGGLFWHSDHYTDAATATHRAYSRRNVATDAAQPYGGGPSNEHNYTTGILHYYFLTGDTGARDTVQGLADWVINMDDGSRRLLGCLDRRPTGLCSSTAHWDYHGPGRGAGNSINALLDGYLLTHDASYLRKAEQLIGRCIHPRDNIRAHGLDDVEYRWSYTVFLQVLGKYLDLKTAIGVSDYMSSYARASLLHYATWMLEHEVPYTRVFDRVKIPTETWPAQDMRKSHVFYLAAKYAIDPLLRDAFQQKAMFFFQVCLQDVQAFQTCTLTRPIVLLLTNAYIPVYFQQHLEAIEPLPAQHYDFGRPRRFTPQFYELYRVRETLHRARSSMQVLRRRLHSLMPTIQSPM
jgi:exo-rhamnogalacturonan lyase-like protein